MSTVGSKELLQSAHDAAGSKRVYQRIPPSADEGSSQKLDAYVKSADHSAEVVTGFGYVGDLSVYAFIQGSEVDGGAMSRTQAHKIRKLYDLALKTGTPIVGIYDSMGGHLKEGVELLVAHRGILSESNNPSGVVPQASIVLDPCIGTSASIAVGTDFVIMAENATFTIETVDKDDSVKAAPRPGLAHWVERTEEDILNRARKVLCRPPSNNLSLASEADTFGVCNNSELQEGAKVTDTISVVVDDGNYMGSYLEYGTSAITGLALINGTSAGMIGYQDTAGLYCCSKAARSVRFRDAFLPLIVTIVDADRFTSLRETVEFFAAHSEVTTIKTIVISGQAADTFYTATVGRGTSADVTATWANAVIPPISSAAVAPSWPSGQLVGSENPIEQRKQLIGDYKTTQTSPSITVADGYVEDITLPEETRQELVSHLEMLVGKRVPTLLKEHSNIPT